MSYSSLFLFICCATCSISFESPRAGLEICQISPGGAFACKEPYPLVQLLPDASLRVCRREGGTIAETAAAWASEAGIQCNLLHFAGEN